MTNFYLDIETTGFDKKKDKLVTIQTCRLDEMTGRQLTPLVIFKAWDEGGERKVLEDFLQYSGLTPDAGPFTFVPLGFNLASFDLPFIMKRLDAHCLPMPDLVSRPHLDLKTTGIFMNRGQFKNSGLDKLTGKPHDGSVIPKWYEEGQYDKILEYIRRETAEFIEFAGYLYGALPQVLENYKREVLAARSEAKALAPAV